VLPPRQHIIIAKPVAIAKRYFIVFPRYGASGEPKGEAPLCGIVFAEHCVSPAVMTMLAGAPGVG
jgi:hypothetical protein